MFNFNLMGDARQRAHETFDSFAIHNYGQSPTLFQKVSLKCLIVASMAKLRHVQKKMSCQKAQKPKNYIDAIFHKNNIEIIFWHFSFMATGDWMGGRH